MSGPDVFGNNPYVSASDVRSRLVLVLRGSATNRGLNIEPFRSRGVQQHDIHEIMISDVDASPGAVVDRVALIGFVEILTGGVITSRSEMFVGDLLIGRVIGFDETHAPNHLNICVFSPEFVDGFERDLAPGLEVSFRLPPVS